MSDNLPIVNEVPEKTPRWTREQAAEVGLPTPEAINYMVAIAKLVLDGSLCTEDLYGGLARTDSRALRVVQANALTKMLFGWEHGIKPLEALRSTWIIRNKFIMHYALMLDELQRKGFRLKWLQTDAKACKIEAHPPGDDAAAFSVSFTIEDAKLAGFENQLYKTRPEDMLVSKAVGRLYRRSAVGGVVYTPEEAEEIEATEVKTIETVERQAGVDKPPPDETLIPPEVESQLRNAAHEAGKNQGWAVARLAEIQAIAQDAIKTAATPAAGAAAAGSLVKSGIEIALKELKEVEEKRQSQRTSASSAESQRGGNGNAHLRSSDHADAPADHVGDPAAPVTATEFPGDLFR